MHRYGYVNGWNDTPPGDMVPDPDPRVEEISIILDDLLTAERATGKPKLTEAVIEQIRKLADELSDELRREASKDCIACLNREAEDMQGEG